MVENNPSPVESQESQMTSNSGIALFKHFATPKQRALARIAEDAYKVVGLRYRQKREHVHSQCFVAKDLAMWLKQSLVRPNALLSYLPVDLRNPR